MELSKREWLDALKPGDRVVIFTEDCAPEVGSVVSICDWGIYCSDGIGYSTADGSLLGVHWSQSRIEPVTIETMRQVVEARSSPKEEIFRTAVVTLADLASCDFTENELAAISTILLAVNLRKLKRLRGRSA
jgi:hypothetical protein